MEYFREVAVACCHAGDIPRLWEEGVLIILLAADIVWALLAALCIAHNRGERFTIGRLGRDFAYILPFNVMSTLLLAGLVRCSSQCLTLDIPC